MTEVTSEVELYDHEVRKIGAVGAQINARFANKQRATRQNLDEWERFTRDAFYQAGFHILIDTSEALLSIGNPQISIVARVSGSDDDKFGHDHERHAWEIQDSVAKGEDKHMRDAFKNMYSED